ncbi:fumarylacetoacetate hydrolase family protein [Saccharopolyspora hirsuta]|uniref:fumarylacetoacetate hydrolase family protein n=1 Tax=Saccharopolyspora hirsuta TaxID=1837 RepID=UPI003322ED2C
MAETRNPFALGTFAGGGREFPGLVVGDRVLDLSAAPDVPATVLGIVERWAELLPRLAELAAGADLPSHAVDELSVRAPLQPRQVVQAGANYRTHVIDLAVKHAELGAGRTEEQVRAETAAMMDRRAAEGAPYLFLGLPSAVAGPYDDVVLPAGSEKHDWELELAAVIGRRAFRVGRDEALEHVAGYTIVNDLTTRDLVFRRDMPEIGTDWLRAKNAPGFLPTGPWLVPATGVDPSDLRVTLELNGRTMQDESTADMIFDVAALVAAASQTFPLLPGDLVLTGSPAGNGMHHGRLLRPGDVVEGTITGLGTQRTRCVAESGEVR